MHEKKQISQDREKHLLNIREKLFLLIKKNNALNLRNLSRSLGRNDAYLQQYIKRGSPNYLPEEERNELSRILNINSEDLTPPWLNIKKTRSKNIFKIKKLHKNKISYIELPQQLLNNIKFSDESNLFFYEFNLNKNTENKKIIRVVVDTGVNEYEDNNDYILDDNNNLFLAEIKLEKNALESEKKLIVKPLEEKFSPFRIDFKKLNFFGKVLIKSKFIYD